MAVEFIWDLDACDEERRDGVDAEFGENRKEKG